MEVQEWFPLIQGLGIKKPYKYTYLSIALCQKVPTVYQVIF